MKRIVSTNKAAAMYNPVSQEQLRRMGCSYSGHGRTFAGHRRCC